MNRKSWVYYVRGGQRSPTMAFSRFSLLWIVFLLVHMVTSQDDGVKPPEIILSNSEDFRQLPLNLGHRPHECVGNVNLCPNGFTLDLNFKPRPPNHELPADYIVSTGGQSMLSNGFYFRRNYGMEYEVGVAKGKRLWSVKFDLDWQSGVDVNIAIAWMNALDVYVDGFLLRSDATGKSRIYTNPEFDPFIDTVIGGANDVPLAGIAPHEGVIYGIRHWDKFHDETEIKGLIPTTIFRRGCVATPQAEAENVNLDDSSSPTDNCRTLCKQKGKRLALLDPTSQTCVCHTPTDLKGYLASATNAEPCWSVYLTTSAVTASYPIGFSYSAVLPTGNDYVRPNETIVYNLNADGANTEVIFHIDFGDGSKLTTSDRKISHFWQSVGTYTVNITAESRSSSETKVFEVQIQWVDEGVKPEKVKIEGSYTLEARQINIDTYFISPAKMKCVLNYGDGNKDSWENLEGFVQKKSSLYTYETVGFYNASVACTNAYGTSNDAKVIPVKNTTMDYMTKVLGTDIIIPFYGPNAHTDGLNFEVELDRYIITPVLTEQSIKIPKDKFNHSGEHLIEVKSNGELLRRRVVNLQEAINRIEIKATLEHTTIDNKILFTFEIESGDHIHVLIDFGDGKEERLYFPKGISSGPIVIYRSHNYQQHGKFEVKLSAANDVSFKTKSKLISIERHIGFASVSVQNVTFLGENAEFLFDVDSDVQPPLPIHVQLDLGNGHTAKAIIGENREHNTPAVFRYQYPQYGIYHVHVNVSNNLSHHLLETSLQVGENITYVDLKTSKQVAKQDEEIEIHIDCPKGQPILYEISTGNGQIIKISVPNNYVPEHDMVMNRPESSTTPHTYFSTEDMSVYIASNDSNVDVHRRKKREAGVSQGGGSEGSTASPQSGDLETSTASTSTAVPTRPSNEVIVTRFSYKDPGQYTVKVKVSNAFGYKKTWSCPPVRVVPSLSTLSCETMDATLSVQTSEQKPMVAFRSEEVSLSINMDTSCSKLSVDPIYDYTWHSEKRSSESPAKWRPELGVCHAGHKEPTLSIPPRTLWYGQYHMKVTVRMRVDPSNVRVRRAVADGVTVTMEPTTDEAWLIRANIDEQKKKLEEELKRQLASHMDVVPEPEDATPLDLNGLELTEEMTTTDFYIDIHPSPLVAKFKDDAHLDIPKYDTINLDFEESHDPDVDLSMNRTGMMAHVFCYPDRLKSEWTSKTLDEKLGTSVEITTNALKTARLYDNECFMTYDRVWVLGWGAVFLADNLYKNDSMNFELYVVKDERVATASKSVRVLFSNATGVDMLNNIDALLASGNTNAALLVIDLVSGMLDSPAAGSGENETSAKAARSNVRGKLLGALEKVSGKIQNFDQVEKTTGALSSVTQVKDEVTEDSKVTAAGALDKVGNATETNADGISVDKITGIGGDVVSTVGNVLPFPEEEEDGGLGGLTTEGPMVVITTMSATGTTTTVTTPTSKTVTTTSPLGVQVTTTPMTPTSAPAGPVLTGNLSVTVEGVGEMTLSPEGWTTTTPIPTPPPTTTTTAAPTTKTQAQPTATSWFSTTFVPTNFMTTLPPGTDVAPTEEPEIPCCERVPEGGLCEWVEPECDFLAEDDRKKIVWSDHICDEIHPDDMEIIVKRFRMYKAQQKRIMYHKRKLRTTGALKAVDSIGKTVLKKIDGTTNVSIASPNLKVSLDKVDGSGKGSENGISVPDSALNGQGGNVGAMSMVSPNPFTYSDSASAVKGDVKSHQFTDENGNEIPVKDSKPIDIYIDGRLDFPAFIRKPVRRGEKQDLLPGFGRFVLVPGTMNPHEINVSNNDSSIHAIIIPDDPDDEVEVFIKYMDYPNSTYYDEKGTVPFVEADGWDKKDETNLLRYTFFPRQNGTVLNGTYRIGVNSTGDSYRNISYQMMIITSGCRFWDLENDTWSSEGCWVGQYTTVRRVQCQCTHLTSFGSDFVVPPNTINFATVFSAEKFIEAIPVFVTVALVLIIYILALIWARRQDKKDLIKWGAGPLEDNLPSDNYNYQITINTGVKKKSGTKSRVSFILSGDHGDTGVRRLYDGKRKEFPTGSIYNFVMSVEASLGPLTYLRIWHDNSGPGKSRSWFLGQVQVVDLQTGEKFFFLCDRWLAVEEDDGMVERIIPVAGMNDLTAFKHLFNSSVRKKLTNDHLWVSIMSRPTRSTFTRVQRLSCCVSLLFLTMISNCMFFKADEKTENVSVVKVGPLTFTLHQLFISVVTTAIVFPPNLFIVVVFRKARPKKNAIQHQNQQASKRFKWRSLNGGSAMWSTAQRSRTQKFKDTMRNIMTSHQSAAKYEEEATRPLNKKKKKGFTLPHWMMYIAWIMVFFSIVGSGFFTILYSMEWGREKSLEWLSTFLLSFFQSVVVVQPVKVLLLAAFISCVLRKPEIDDEEADFDDAHGGAIDDAAVVNRSEKDLQALMMQRKMANESLKPPDTASLEASRKLRLQEIQMEAVLKECIIYLFFLVVLFFLSYQARDGDSFMYAENIKNTFVRNSPSFDSIVSPQTYWKYINNALLPNLYSGDWYNGKELNWRERLQIDDRNTMRVGIARLRQHRIKDDTCIIRKEFQTWIHHCRDGYSWTDDDTKDYLRAWEIPSSDAIHRQGIESCYMDDVSDDNMTSLHDEESPWIYRSSLELKNAPYMGNIATYKGGGYTFTFKRTVEHTKRLLAELEEYEWVDPNTRALFVEFTLYNANVNLFSSVILLVEFMATGSAITKAEVKVFRLSSYIGGWGVIIILLELTFLGFVVFFFVNVCRLLKKERMKFFKEFWNLLEFAMLILALVSIVMYAIKAAAGKVAMYTLHESQSGDYVNFVTISIWDELFGFILAMVVFCATIKFIKMLKFNKRMGMLGDTIKLATKDLSNFSVVFFGFFFAFSMMAYVLYGKMSSNYGTFIGSVESLFRFALGDFDFYEMQNIQPVVGPIFFFLYVAVIYIALMGVFLTIIYESFAAVKENTALQANDYEIVDFMVKRFKGVFGWS